MRKKFLQGAATLSMAAAVCIMSGLVTASAGTVEAGNVAIDYNKQQLVVTLNQKGVEVSADDVKAEDLDAVIAQYINTEGTVLLEDAKSGDTVSLAATGKTVKLGDTATYTAGGKEIKNVTITATITNNDDQQILDSSNWTLKKDVSEIKFEGDDKDTLPVISVTAEITKSDGSSKTTSNARTIVLAKGTAKKSSDDREVLFNVASVDKNGKLKPSAWEVYDIGGKDEIAIDLTSLNTQKDNYVQVKGDRTGDAITIFIPQTDKTVKLKMNGATGKVEMTNGTDASKKADLEYRTQYSGWQGYGAVSSDDVADLSLYQERGANLYFRLASEDGKVAIGAPDTSIKITDKASNEEIEVVKMPSLPGKEIKVAVAKKANAPKATVNYKKGTVIIPKGALYRVNDENSLGKFTETATSAKVELKEGEEFDKLLAGGSLEVKKAGDASKKKAESKIFLLEIPNAKETLELAKGDSAKDVKDNTVKDGENFVTASSEVDKDKNSNPASIKLTVKNGTGFDYEVVVDKSRPGADKKGKVVKAGKDVTIAKIDKGGSTVWIRKCADQKKAIWATDYFQMGVIPEAKAEGEKDPEKETVTKADLEAIAKQYLTSSINIKNLTGVKENDVAKIAIDGSEFDLSKKDFEITSEGSSTKKPIKGVTVTVTAVSNQGTTGDAKILNETDYSNGIKYGNGVSSAQFVMGSATVSATITFSYGEGDNVITYPHTINFVYE